MQRQCYKVLLFDNSFYILQWYIHVKDWTQNTFTALSATSPARLTSSLLAHWDYGLGLSMGCQHKIRLG